MITKITQQSLDHKQPEPPKSGLFVIYGLNFNAGKRGEVEQLYATRSQMAFETVCTRIRGMVLDQPKIKVASRGNTRPVEIAGWADFIQVSRLKHQGHLPMDLKESEQFASASDCAERLMTSAQCVRQALYNARKATGYDTDAELKGIRLKYVDDTRKHIGE